MQPNINNMMPYYHQTINNQAVPTNFSAGLPVSSGAAIVDKNPIVKQVKNLDTADTNAGANPNTWTQDVMTGMSYGVPALAIPAWIINNHLTKDYDKTLFSKIEQYGDRLQTKPWIKNTIDKVKNIVNSAKNNSTLQNSEIIKSIRFKPSVAGKMGQGQAEGTIGTFSGKAFEYIKSYAAKNSQEFFANYAANPTAYAAEIKEIQSSLVRNPKMLTMIEDFIANPNATNLTQMLNNTKFAKLPNGLFGLKKYSVEQLLRDYAANPAAHANDIQKLRSTFLRNPAAHDALAKFIANPSAEINNILGHSSTITTDPKLRAFIRKAGKKTYKYADEIFAKLNDIATKNPTLLNQKLGGKSLTELLNKLHLIDGYKKVLSSSLGQKISGGLFRTAEAGTCGLVGGLGGVLGQAFFIGMAYKTAKAAPKGERLKVFMDQLFSTLGFMLTMGIQMRVLNHVAGMKFIGMKPEHYANYHRAVELARKAAKEGNRTTYDRLVKLVKAYETKANANVSGWSKVFQKIGKVLSMGRVRETIKPFKGQSKFLHRLKFGGGFILRTAIIMGVLSPLFCNWATKLSHMIFGKPQSSMNEKELAEFAQKHPDKVIKKTEEDSQSQNSSSIQPTVEEQPSAPVQQKPGNLLDEMNNPKPRPVANTPISDQPLASNPVKPTKSYTYIPNPILGAEPATNLAQSRSGKVDALMRQADLAEMAAQNLLGNI